MDPGSSSSSKFTSSVHQLNESLYELHRPPGRPSLQVLFFHGFQLGDYEGAHLSAWTSGDGSCIWPPTWLVEEFPKAHVLTVAYHASLMKTRECRNIDLFVIGENIMSDLLQANIGQEVGCQVVLVGHSFGGLAMKEVCLHAQKKGSFGSTEHEIFLRSVKGLFFYATPHHGIASKLAERFVNQGQLLEYVKTLSTCAARLNEDFGKLVKLANWRTAGVGENLPMKWSFLETSVVVEEASSRYGDDFRIVMDADHISISRPKRKTSTSFNSLTSFLARFSNISRIPGNFQHLPKLLAGVDPVIEEIKLKLRNATCLGLVGMGGIGKSTLAKALFNALEQSYEYSCFLKDVKKRKEEVVDLLLKNIHFRGKINAQEGGLGRLSGRLLLLVLDDVDSEQDLEILSILRDDYLIHPDSRVLVTSRDSELLNRCLGALDGSVHEVRFLGPQISKELLLSYAFRKGNSPSSFERKVDAVVRKCGGLPLTLEVIGKYLYGKSEAIWAQAVRALDKAEAVAGLDEQIWAKLKLSYDGLDREEQEMFLDAATVFLMDDLDMAKEAWSITTSGFEDMRWQRLVDLSLVWEVRDEEVWGKTIFEVGMHEQLTCLGRKLALSHGEHGRRLWLSQEESPIVWGAIQDTNNVQDIIALRLFNGGGISAEDCAQEGFHTGNHSTKEFHFSTTCDGCNMWPIEGPRFKSCVLVDYDLCLGCFKKSSTNASEYDQVHQPAPLCGGYQQEDSFSIPGSTLAKMGKLRYLALWNTDIGQTHGAAPTLPPTLLCLFFYLMRFSELPFNPSHHKQMTSLIFHRCDGLQTLPEIFGQLSSLQSLTIQAPKLTSLPASLGHLQMLKTLRISSCKILKLPETLGNLVALEHLILDSCGNLSALPKSLGCLSSLKWLYIEFCYELHELPESFLRLQQLKHIVLRSTSLQCVPDLENLRSLKTLQINWAGAASCPKLPICLERVISRENYQDNLSFKVSNGQFVRVEDFK